MTIMKKIRFILLGFLISSGFAYSQGFELIEYASGFSKPVDIANAGDDRLFIVEKDGKIRIIESGNVLPEDFLDIDPQVNSSANERGLLGLAFHPKYSQNGYFFVHYNNLNGTTTISRFSVSADPNIADKSSEKIILTIPQPYNNHNGGDLNFGPEGYLYIGMGDGGAAGDPENRAQNRQTLLGKMLRIDVDNGDPYSIPEDNPFAMDDFTLDEIWALGLRNPWRFSFDRLTGDMYIGDVGQNKWEEIDFEPGGDPGGRNYGWRCYEGDEDYNLLDCPGMAEMTFPIHTYQNNSSADGCSVTGGYVYRGQDVPGLYGKYIYGDYCSGKIWSLEMDACGIWHNEQVFDGPAQNYCSFGEDKDGELYLAALGSGIIYRIHSSCSISVLETTQNENCNEQDGSIYLDISGGVEPVQVQWNNGSEGTVLEGLQAGEYSYTITDGGICKLFGCVELFNEANIPACNFGFGELTVCAGELGQIQLNSVCPAPPGYYHIWYQNGDLIPDENGPELIVTESGSYSVQLTNGDCSNEISDPVEITFIPSGPGPEIIWNSTLDTAFVIADTFVSYIWFIEGMEINGVNGASVPLNGSTGPITVFGIDAFGCMSTMGGPVFVESIQEIAFIRHIEVTPNPFTDYCRIYLELSASMDFLMTISDSSGKKLRAFAFNDIQILDFGFDLVDFQKGIYIISLDSNAGKYSTRIVKH